MAYIAFAPHKALVATIAMTEALSAVIDFGFQNLELQAVLAEAEIQITALLHRSLDLDFCH